MRNLPIALTAKAIGVADLTGAMPIFSISSEDVSGEVFGHFRFDLSIYAFNDSTAVAFLLGREAVPLDPIADVERAEFGDRVKVTLTDYWVAQTETLTVVTDLVLEQVDLLTPTRTGDPMVMTRSADLETPTT